MSDIKIRPKGRRIKQRTQRARAKSAVTASPRTIAFKEKIQKTLSLSGIAVNKNLAWQIYKDLFYATVEFTVNDPEQRLPLSGVGTFSVRQSVPRRGKAEEYHFVPRFKVKPSSRINALLEDVMPECRKDYVADGDTEKAAVEEAPANKTRKKPSKKQEKVIAAPVEDDLDDGLDALLEDDDEIDDDEIDDADDDGDVEDDDFDFEA